MLKYLNYLLIAATASIVPLYAAEQNLYPRSAIHISSEKSSYTLIKLIGKGEQAEVFQSVDSQGSMWAIKRLYSKKQMSSLYPAEYLEAIFAKDGSSLLAHREFAMSQRLDHPHILKIHDCFTRVDAEDGEVHTYLVSELIQGETLAEAVRGSLSRQQVIQNGVALLDALKHAFRQNLIHEDLYADNIMIGKQGQLKLIDIDAFEEWPTGDEGDEDVSTAREYASGIVYVLQDVLACGDFCSEDLYALTETLFEKIQNHPHIDQKISQGSQQSLISLLEGMENVFTHGEFDDVQKSSNDLGGDHSHVVDVSAGKSAVSIGGGSTL
jgi:serine/threonine protein kinase